MSPLNRRRLSIFKANHRGMVSLVIFCLLFLLSLFAEVIANDKPILVLFEGQILFPVFTAYPETHFGGEFPTEADYKDPYLMELVFYSMNPKISRHQELTTELHHLHPLCS